MITMPFYFLLFVYDAIAFSIENGILKWVFILASVLLCPSCDIVTYDACGSREDYTRGTYWPLTTFSLSPNTS